MYSNPIINKERYSEIQNLDELLRELQDETANADWGYWHFSLLNLEKGESLKNKIYNTLFEIPKHREPYNTGLTAGTKTYNSLLDLNNMRFEKLGDLKTEIVSRAEHWAHYEGPTSIHKTITERFHDLKYIVADKLVDFLNSKNITDTWLVEGIDTCYSFGGDHCGDDILVETDAGTYVIHLGFST